MRTLFIISIVLFSFSSCDAQKKSKLPEITITSDVKTIEAVEASIDKVVKTEADWKKELNDQEFYVLRQQGTERAFTGDLLNIKDDGVYTCRGCGLELFDSKTKFESGSGWPSFYQPINNINVGKEEDTKFGMIRTEVHCNRCDGHLGHVFDDGPKPTGLRYCINSVSLDFVKKDN